ncbi:hypothetical protein MMC09_005756 [Bachmanniomyces sp. S44760]|nr:hypothetical protein [Bachmanniomyces sp. S44760]
MTSPCFRFPSGNFNPIFQLLDINPTQQSTLGRDPRSVRTIQPKFDVRETKDSYELNGELPGVDHDHVSIEFSDSHTIVIKGRSEREITDGNLNAALEHTTTQDLTAETSKHTKGSYHKASVEDDDSEDDTAGRATPTTSTTGTETTKSSSRQPETPKSRSWINERSVGDFHRSFSFPSRVDQDNVKASLRNGILSIVIPKSHGQAGRRIEIM